MLTWLTKEIPSRPLGLTRALVGFAAFLRALIAIPVMARLVDPTTATAPHFDWFPEPSAGLAIALIGAWLLSSLAFMLGWHTTAAGIVLAGSVGSTLALDQQLYANHLYLMTWLVVLLTLADAGAGLSVRRADRPAVRWPVFLLMTQLSVVYGFSGMTKLNEDFLSGTVLAGVLRGGLVEFPDPLRIPSVLTVLAAASVAVELFVALFIWRPRFRPAAFVLGLGLHVSIILLMSPTGELVVFALEMLALYPLFLSVDRLRLSTQKRCGACESLAGRTRRFDILRTLDISETVGHSTSHVHLDHLSESTDGFAAVTRTREHLVPHLWIAPLGRLPGVKQWGQRRHERRHRHPGQ